MTLTVENLWLIPAAPLLAAAISALTPRHGRDLSATLSIAGIVISFVLSCAALSTALDNPSVHATANFDWFELGVGAVRLGWLLDPLTALMCVMVTLVSTLIFIFSLGYMKEDANFTRFFCFLSFFAAAMLGILIANSLLLLFVCWELVGLASYLLIGFWFHQPEAAAAAKKAFIVTRIGDLGFLLGILWLYESAGSLLLYDGGQGVLEASTLNTLTAQATLGGLAVSTAIGLLIFCGAVGKSGQFPLHVWLPDAMEGPTPVSALIHAATMVAAGVFLIARVYPLMAADQVLALSSAAPPFHALTIVAFVGATTALLGSLIAVAQNDLKRILAFSTVSQLGYMMLALGVGSWIAAIFHLLTHAFFKALLFLGAGSVIHATHHEQNIRKLGGLSSSMRVTFLTFAIGMMALAGVPFLFSGFWSKETILHAAHAWDVSHVPFYVALIGVVLTAFYMTRLIAETFFGQARSVPAQHAHENSTVMTLPLIVLAVGAIAVGFLGTPAWPWLQSALAGHPIKSQSLWEGGGLMMLSIVLILFGLGAGWALYGRRLRISDTALDPLTEKAPAIFALMADRMRLDELYAGTFGRLNSYGATLAAFFDRVVWAGLVNTFGRLSNFAGGVSRLADEAGLNGGFDSTSESLRNSGRAYSRAQTGDAHGYLRTLAIAFALLALFVVLGGGS